MKVAVIGTGYVGVTTGVALAMAGHEVTGVDVDEEKIRLLQAGRSPIYEPGLDEALTDVITRGKLEFTTDLTVALLPAQVIFICVGTPSDQEGRADLRVFKDVIDQVHHMLRHNVSERVLVIKSTVPVGSNDQVAQLFSDCPQIHVASNPEFLREGSALHDSLEPARIVMGASSTKAFHILEDLYVTIDAPRIKTSRLNAEMIKYASNAFLSMRISFMNELARLSDKLGTDISIIATGMGLDSRIGPEFLRAGLGYGGSCFPKDTSALLSIAQEKNEQLNILYQVIKVNEQQPAWFLHKVEQRLGGLARKRIALLGLSFKPDTDDIREAPAQKLLTILQKKEAIITAYDPVAMPNMQCVFSPEQVTYTRTAYEAVTGADAVILCTEWREFLQLDYEHMYHIMKQPLIFDGRNALAHSDLRKIGFEYVGIGNQVGSLV
ncbi:UDP-glucose/GDP-mannose dehydrogenase family protein [Brevibacillus laterosporus]|uniref:UDP-glucose dehydrogenase family protein n=1 Tax=Brevibacillus laterosporus TaxID=1465 RepID=UPI00035C80F3|nr:UDP-glucose/GDP-mannose dehydrogenase family protein [Brevibacillus laterosporus]ATO51260.1 UDP-glucose 6-dehydrogenase [Brevibacillus laterosporus DSM 25]MBG9804196.1 UDP-glucose 6-dehydrogenase [Brevibacillus laterosporus]MED2004090.1 UDP-glucose/GDP-mannose dehydrogenase family protein [Brevibacillus laterosporus]MED4763307.1 UDP-glucose/GDP-mannose dehydrogenase family protein [Brevibacillus laterosporus]TPH14776.1 UDP-glucose/GDP-mannose dehydrogenase family protein [Brevibacillus late